MAGKAGGILKGGAGNNSGVPDTDEIVIRSPLSMVRTGNSLASKKPQWTVVGPASMRGMSIDFCTILMRVLRRLVSVNAAPPSRAATAMPRGMPGAAPEIRGLGWNYLSAA